MPMFRSDDGTEIFYRCWDGGPGVPVVLHHGFVVNSELDWVNSGVVACLTAAGRTVVAPDARGHGRSGKPHDPAQYGEDRMARDLSLLIDVLGVPQVDLAGYSMGAVVTLITAAQDCRVRRLVVGGVGAAAVEQGGVDADALGRHTLADALLTPEPETITDPAAAAFRWLADETGGDRVALAAQSTAVHRKRIALERITAPTLVLAGREDTFATRPEVLADALPNARLQLLPGGHGEDLHGPEFGAALTSFLAEQSARHDDHEQAPVRQR